MCYLKLFYYLKNIHYNFWIGYLIFRDFFFQPNCSLFNDMAESVVVPQANLKIVLSGIWKFMYTMIQFPFILNVSSVSGENSASASLEFLLNVLSTKREKLYPIFQLTCNSSSPTKIDNFAWRMKMRYINSLMMSVGNMY